MVIPRHKWFELKRNGIKFELIVRDQDFKKIETKKFGPREFDTAMKDIGNRYGIKKDMLSPKDDIKEELDWLRKESII